MKGIITEFLLSRALNAEHFELHQQFLTDADEAFAQAIGLSDLRLAYSQLLAQENVSYIYERTLENTKDVERLDRERDALFMFMSKVANAAVLLPIADMAQAGVNLVEAMKTFKDTPSMKYRANTSMLREMLQKLSQPQRVADITKLSLNQVVEVLATTNEQFAAIYSERADARQVRDSAEPMKTVRPRVDEAARAFFHAINTVYQFNELITHDADKKALMEPVIDRINAEIHDFQVTIDSSSSNPTNRPGDNTGEANTGGNSTDATDDQPGGSIPEQPGQAGGDNTGGNSGSDTPDEPTPNPGGDSGDNGGNGEPWDGEIVG